jgi:hypothetical protein
VCRQRRPRARAASATLALLVLTLASVLGGCPCVKTITDWSPALRWWLFATYGAGRICPEMLKQGISLRLEDRSPAIGRFFPAQCAYNVNDEAKTVTVHVGGTGYGYMAPAKRVGFALSVSVEYRADFMIAGDDMYVWGRPNRIVQARLPREPARRSCREHPAVRGHRELLGQSSGAHGDEPWLYGDRQ